MKNIKGLKINSWVGAIMIFMMVVSCHTLEETYQEFTIDGETIYIGKSDTVIVGAGYNKLRFWVAINSDPKISKGLLESNDGVVNHEFDVVRTRSGKDTISFDLDIPEGEYTFGLFLLDQDGNRSVRQEFQSAVYGEKYTSSLINRGILNIEAYETSAVINWSDAPGNAIETLLKYEDNTGVIQTVNVLNDDMQTFIDSYKLGGRIIISTTYKPTPNAIEIFEAEPFETAFPQGYLLVKTTWSVIDFSTQHPGGANAAINVIDGNPGTRWHTYAGASVYPHHVTVDMGVERTISSFEIFRMTNDDRACNTFQLQVSTDNAAWTDLGQFNFDRFTNNGQHYSIASQPTARYFKFVGLTGPHDYMVTGEINVHGY